MVNLTQLIRHPEMMGKDTLYYLRSMVALHPAYQTARLLLLRNLYLLHDPSFEDELRKAALYVSDRSVIFNLVESEYFELSPHPKTVVTSQQPAAEVTPDTPEATSVADEITDAKQSSPDAVLPHDRRNKPTAIDATIDYVSYLMDAEDKSSDDSQPLKGQGLIDDFINNKGGKIELKDVGETAAGSGVASIDAPPQDLSEGMFTETLARIYIKQGKFSKALEIIKRLNLIYPKKNAYFADQIRFLEKLIINSQSK